MDKRIRRSERLKSKQAIDRLFKQGERIRSGKLLLLYHLSTGNGELHYGVTAPKRKLKKAHERNRAKRILRETFRLHKEGVIEQLQRAALRADLFFLYNGEVPPSYHSVEREMIKVLERLENELKGNDPLEGNEKGGS